MSLALCERKSYIYVALVIISCFTNVFTSSISSEEDNLSTVKGCGPKDDECFEIEKHEILNYEAIIALHKQLDDDSSGDIDLAESVDFIKEELHTKDIERRHERFHNNDNHISVGELWKIWANSDVHNWTMETTILWLQNHVGLHQYTETFYKLSINGSILPRIAANQDHYLHKVLGIRNVDRAKLSLKAMDAVLFGPPKEPNHFLKDSLIILLVTVVVIGGVTFYNNKKNYRVVLNQMMLDMEKLRGEEMAFRELKNKLERSESMNSFDDKLLDEGKIDSNEDKLLDREDGYQMDMDLDSEVGEVFKENGPVLQQLLQLTYERERFAFNEKEKEVKEQFRRAKDMCDKLNKKRQTLFGVLSSAHGNVMDNVDQTISRTRQIMEEVAIGLKEREERWTQIEKLSGFTITRNMGLHALELLLRPQLSTSSSLPSAYSNIVQQLLRDQSALMFFTMGGYSGLDRSRDSPSYMHSNQSTREWRQSCDSNLEGTVFPALSNASSPNGTNVSQGPVQSNSDKHVQRSASDHLITRKNDVDSSADEGSVSSRATDANSLTYRNDLTDTSSLPTQLGNMTQASGACQTDSASLVSYDGQEDAMSICSSITEGKSKSRKKNSFIHSLNKLRGKKKRKE